MTLELFLQKLEDTILQMLSLKIIDPKQFGVLGLSRGGFIAGHIASRIQEISTCVVYAPLTRFAAIKEFSSLLPPSLLDCLDLTLCKKNLCQKKIKAYISNRDTRVNTDFCFAWIQFFSSSGLI